MNKYEALQKIVASKGYDFFEGEKNVNLIGVRNSDNLSNEFDDRLLVAIELGGVKQIISFGDFTTDPGFHYLKKQLLNPNGCAILKEGQYKGMWTFGKHRGKYNALVQVGKCTVYRDRTLDNIIDKGNEDTGLFGINHHHAYDTKNGINKYSAGCQVHNNDNQLNVVLQLCHLSAEEYGDKFTYTLLNANDWKNV